MCYQISKYNRPLKSRLLKLCICPLFSKIWKYVQYDLYEQVSPLSAWLTPTQAPLSLPHMTASKTWSSLTCFLIHDFALQNSLPLEFPDSSFKVDMSLTHCQPSGRPLMLDPSIRSLGKALKYTDLFFLLHQS